MYLVVEFLEDPKSYGVIPLESVNDGSVRANVNAHVGKSTKVQWGKKCFDGIILQTGSKKDMNNVCNTLAEKAAECEIAKSTNIRKEKSPAKPKVNTKRSARKNKSEEIATLLSKRKKSMLQQDDSTKMNDIADEEPNDIANGNSSEEASVLSEERIADADPEFDQADLKARVAKLEKRVEKLKRGKQKLQDQLEEQKQLNESLHRRLDISSSSSKKIELVVGSGVFLRASKIAAAKLGAKTPSILARKLFRYLFSADEMRGHSITGRKCNANKGLSALPSVDPIKRDAIVEFTLTTFNLKPSLTKKGIDEYQIQKSKILSSLGKLLREDVNKVD